MIYNRMVKVIILKYRDFKKFHENTTFFYIKTPWRKFLENKFKHFTVSRYLKLEYIFK